MVGWIVVVGRIVVVVIVVVVVVPAVCRARAAGFSAPSGTPISLQQLRHRFRPLTTEAPQYACRLPSQVSQR